MPEVSKKKQRLPTESNEEFGSNPFGELDTKGLDSIPLKSAEGAEPKIKVSVSETIRPVFSMGFINWLNEGQTPPGKIYLLMN